MICAYQSDLSRPVMVIVTNGCVKYIVAKIKKTFNESAIREVELSEKREVLKQQQLRTQMQ